MGSWITIDASLGLSRHRAGFRESLSVGEYAGPMRRCEDTSVRRILMKSLACTFVCLLLAASVAQAQGVGTSGEVTGTVTDSSGGLVLKATVNVVDSQTGLKRMVTTNSTGQYRAAGLPPAGQRRCPTPGNSRKESREANRCIVIS